ncbi:FAD:protein FMN transferase [Pontibacterium sp.]|uniref:FAD:protein FMN transferase n=1 Tax=Pontibacterium sp. TaxID=2036026 RepID=UPI00351559B7
MRKLFTQLKLVKWPAALLLAIFVITGCQQSREEIRAVQGLTMGTSYSVKWVSKDADTQKVHAAIEAVLKDINQSMSTYIDTSELSRLNQSSSTDWQPLSSALYDVLRLSTDLSEQTEGAFDVTVGPLVNLWGFGPEGRVVTAPSGDKIEAERIRVGFEKIALNATDQQIKKSVAELYIDLSAVAKGYAVDRVASLLEEHGHVRYLVEVGGELRAKGLKPGGKHWRIAIETPDAATRSVQKIINVKDVAIATSGDYRNYFEENGVRFSHTIDPSSGKPINHRLASVTVLASSCAEADALATAFMVMGTERGYKYAMQHRINALFINKGDTGFEEIMTPGFKKYLAN